LDKAEIESFRHLLEALAYGCPPHGGIALGKFFNSMRNSAPCSTIDFQGLDRLISILVGTNNIRDVIAFPKTHMGNDMMVNSPSSIPNDLLHQYGLTLDERSPVKMLDS
jgi:aspartyl-tRNA synthetase